MCRDRKNESGSIVVEGSFVIPVFMLAVFFVINLVNIFAVHNRIQYAINATAHELASYTYLYAALSLGDAEQTIESDGEQYIKPIDQASDDILSVLEQFQTLKTDTSTLASQVQNPELSSDYADELSNQVSATSQDVQNLGEAGKSAYQSVGNVVANPKESLVGAGYIGVEAAIYAIKSQGTSVAARKLTEKYLEVDGKSADDYLKHYGISEGYAGLDFKGSSALNDTGSIHKGHRLIDIVVAYDIDMSPFSLVLGQAKLHVNQRVTIPAWQDGDGVEPPSK